MSMYTGPNYAKNMISYSLSSPPGDAIIVRPTLSPSNMSRVLTIIPPTIEFTASTARPLLTRGFFLSGTDLVTGLVEIYLNISGPSTWEFEAPKPVTINVLASFQPLPPPVLLSALLSDSGAYAFYTFDGPTDLAGLLTSRWPCKSLFTFVDVNSTLCTWVNASTVATVAG